MQKEEASGKFNENAMFTYNYYKKLGFAILLGVLIFLLVGFVLFYFFGLRNSDNIFVNAINSFISHITSNIAQASLLGAFYASFFGGLFFVPIPMEVLYVAFLRVGHNVFGLTFIYMIGIIASYGVNYIIGYRLRGISKKLVGAKSFYKTKVALNKYGPLGIFIFNATPLPSQPLCVVLGVFNYNRKKFWVYTLAGELVKFITTAIGYFYIT